MSNHNTAGNLYDPRKGDQAIRAQSLCLDSKPMDPARTNYFSIYYIRSGSGIFWADASSFEFGPDSLLFFVPYQHIRLIPECSVQAEVIQFHANFLCVETFHAEVGCSGVLFNDPYGRPIVTLNKQSKPEVVHLVERIRHEQSNSDLAFGDAMLAYLKILLILAARLKTPMAGACTSGANDPRHPIVIQLRDLIEQNFHSMHSPAEYAKQLHVTAKTLGRIVREQLGTTPTDLIRNRILIHAKWQLLHTLKPVKGIASELGFADELYFSRLFKRATGYSPTFFRDFETAIRGGSNLSMFSSPTSILKSSTTLDT